MRATLFGIASSHPSLAGQLMLEHKGIEVRRIDLVPGVHRAVLQDARVSGGDRAGDQDRRGQGAGHAPDRARAGRAASRAAALPARSARTGARSRRRRPGATRCCSRCHVGSSGRASSATGRSSRPISRARSSGIPVSVAARTAPPIAVLARRLNRATDENVQRDLAALPGLLDHVDELIERGVIGGAERNAADYQIATSISLLLTMDDLRPMIEDRPAGQARARGRDAPAGPRCRTCSPSDAGTPTFRRARGVRSSVPMEAATPLRQPHVRALGDRLVDRRPRRRRRVRRSPRSRARAERATTRRRRSRDAIEIGARVLDREQAGANAEFVKTEFEKRRHGARSAVHRPRARGGRALRREGRRGVRRRRTGHSPRSSRSTSPTAARRRAEPRPRAGAARRMARSREDLLKQFSSADGPNPLADFKAGTLRVLKAAEERQHETSSGCSARSAELREADAGAAGREGEARGGRGRARARHRQGAQLRGGRRRRARRDRAGPGRCRRGGRRPCAGPTGKTGDVVVAIDACNGPARGRIVFEAKDRRLSKPEALRSSTARSRQRERRLRGARRAHRGGAAGEARAAARVQRRQAGGRARPRRRARRCRSSSPTGSRGRGC